MRDVIYFVCWGGGVARGVPCGNLRIVDLIRCTKLPGRRETSSGGGSVAAVAVAVDGLEGRK